MNRINDLTGKTFSMLTVDKLSHTKPNIGAFFVCTCKCGNTVTISGRVLKNGKKKNCGCRKNKKLLNGRTYGKLEVLCFTHKDDRGSYCYDCRCDCGNTVNLSSARLKALRVKSCSGPDCPFTPRTHGYTKNRSGVYSVWVSIKQKAKKKEGYDICERWRDSFLDFLEDVGERPSKSHCFTLKGRIYEKDNCSWEFRKSNFKKKKKIIEWEGESFTISQLEEKYGLSKNTLNARLKMGWSLKKCLLTPIHKKNNEYQE